MRKQDLEIQFCNSPQGDRIGTIQYLCHKAVLEKEGKKGTRKEGKKGTVLVVLCLGKRKKDRNRSKGSKTGQSLCWF